MTQAPAAPKKKRGPWIINCWQSRRGALFFPPAAAEPSDIWDWAETRWRRANLQFTSSAFANARLAAATTLLFQPHVLFGESLVVKSVRLLMRSLSDQPGTQHSHPSTAPLTSDLTLLTRLDLLRVEKLLFPDRLCRQPGILQSWRLNCSIFNCASPFLTLQSWMENSLWSRHRPTVQPQHDTKTPDSWKHNCAYDSPPNVWFKHSFITSGCSPTGAFTYQSMKIQRITE